MTEHLCDEFSRHFRASGVRVVVEEVSGGWNVRVFRTGPEWPAAVLFQPVDPEYIGIVLDSGDEYWENEWNVESRLDLARALGVLAQSYLQLGDPPDRQAKVAGLKKSTVPSGKLEGLMTSE